MTRWYLCGLALLAFWTSSARADVAKDEAKKPEQPQVEVVFCLDTTGSMGGLINAAKQKIWAISNQIAAGKPTPRVKVGLLAYRDRSDAYVTKIIDLTDDLDMIHGELMKFQAQGGGDFPESVNQALNESVTKFSWSKTSKVLKMIFLVGDAPPHMDYKDDVKYTDTCQIAVKNDIIINTVQCGNHAETRKYWEEIARLGEGSYVQIDARGGPIVAVATPFDKDLVEINNKLATRTLTFGSLEKQADGRKQLEAAKALAPGAQADRAAFYGNAGKGAAFDLLEQVKNNKVKLEELKAEELPQELRDLKTTAERKEYLEKLDKERAELNKQAVELDQKRKVYIAEEQKKQAQNTARDSFDNRVLNILQRQATRVNIRYESAVPMKEEKK